MAELSDEEIITLIKTEMAKVDRDRVYWVLRDMKIKGIFEATVDVLVICVALHKLGIPITSELTPCLRNRDRGTIVTICHALGDKNVLTMVRGRKSKYLFWMLSETFKKKMGL